MLQYTSAKSCASVAQSVEQLIRNQQVASSSLATSSKGKAAAARLRLSLWSYTFDVEGKAVKRWEKNVVQFAETGDAGCCPDCGSHNIRMDEFKEGRHYSISFLCEDCKSGDHFDGVIPENMTE